MQRTFKSKIDKTYHLLLWVVLLLTFYAFWQRYIGFAIVFLLLSVLLLETFLKTDYTFDGDGYLILRCGLFPKYKINLRELYEVKVVYGSAFSYSLSREKLILSSRSFSKFVSPVNKEDFIREILKYNPNITVIY